MKKFFTLTLIIIAAVHTYAQLTYQKIHGGPGRDNPFSAQKTSDGGLIISGNTSSIGPVDRNFYLVKTNAVGDISWSKAYDGDSIDYGNWVNTTTDGGYIMTGSFYQPSGASYVFLMKTDALGNISWTKKYKRLFSNNAQYVEEDQSGNFIITGSTDTLGMQQGYFMKTDASGNILWYKLMNLPYSQGKFIKQTPDGGYVVAGKAQFGSSFRSQVFILKIDSNGNISWSKHYGDSKEQTAYGLVVESDGGFTIAGISYDYLAPDPMNTFMFRADASGTVVWSSTYSTPDMDYTGSMTETNDGGYALSGELYTDPTHADILLMKIDSIGILSWSKKIGKPGSLEYSVSTLQNADNGYYLAGTTTDTSSADDNLIILRTDANGSSGCLESTVSLTTQSFFITAAPFSLTLDSGAIAQTVAATVYAGGTETSTAECYTSIPENANSNSIAVYPNPTNGTFTISDAWEHSMMEIYDVTGRNVWKQRIENREEQVSVRLSPGIYSIRITGDAGSKQVKLIIR